MWLWGKRELLGWVVAQWNFAVWIEAEFALLFEIDKWSHKTQNLSHSINGWIFYYFISFKDKIENQLFPLVLFLSIRQMSSLTNTPPLTKEPNNKQIPVVCKYCKQIIPIYHFRAQNTIIRNTVCPHDLNFWFLDYRLIKYDIIMILS
jgi:hypothetical protein